MRNFLINITEIRATLDYYNLEESSDYTIDDFIFCFIASYFNIDNTALDAIQRELEKCLSDEDSLALIDFINELLELPYNNYSVKNAIGGTPYWSEDYTVRIAVLKNEALLEIVPKSLDNKMKVLYREAVDNGDYIPERDRTILERLH